MTKIMQVGRETSRPGL